MGNPNNFVVTNYWKTMPDATNGLVDICFWNDQKYGDIMYDLETPLAEHIVAVHNAWWDKVVWDSYRPNLSYSAWYDGLTEDDWFDYDDGYEAP